MLLGIVFRQASSILNDSFANAFNFDSSKGRLHNQHFIYLAGEWQNDHRSPRMTWALWEGKYELDSLASFVRFTARYMTLTHDDRAATQVVFAAAARVIEVVRAMQNSTAEDEEGDAAYFFQRLTYTPTDTLMGGRGAPAERCGLSKSPFRPSDDATTFPFLVLSAVVPTQISDPCQRHDVSSPQRVFGLSHESFLF